MDREDIIPVDPLAIDAAALVSETDVAHSHSSGDEDGGWLSSRHQRRRVTVGSGSGVAINETSPGEENDSDDDVNMSDTAGHEELYCENMDGEDEAWVYRHMRSGKEELVQRQSDAKANSDHKDIEQIPKSSSKINEKSTIKNSEKDGGRNPSGAQDDSSPLNPQLQQALILKPRASDAVLSCPRCFNILCMDCQKHERYANQYRAMFVMNIGVDWNKRMIYDDAIGGLKLISATGGVGGRRENNALFQLHDANVANAPNTIPQDTMSTPNNKEREELYYPVHCSYCQLEVAALDMKDEIYYFFGCIASA